MSSSWRAYSGPAELVRPRKAPLEHREEGCPSNEAHRGLDPLRTGRYARPAVRTSKGSAALALIIVLALLLFAWTGPLHAAPEGAMTWGVHASLAARWLDPAETEGTIIPFMVLYALHDALLKPMPAGLMTPSLAESWTMSKDGLTYEFVLRKNTRFHNGNPVTAEDVKFSFERYRGAGAKQIKEKVREVHVVDPGRVRFHLKEPWPDFLTYYGTTASGVGWIVPKKYVDRGLLAEDAERQAARVQGHARRHDTRRRPPT